MHFKIFEVRLGAFKGFAAACLVMRRMDLDGNRVCFIVLSDAFLIIYALTILPVHCQRYHVLLVSLAFPWKKFSGFFNTKFSFSIDGVSNIQKFQNYSVDTIKD